MATQVGQGERMKPFLKSWRWLCVLPVLCGLASVVSAAESPPLIVTPAGHWLVIVGEDGIPCLEKVGTVLTFTGANGGPGVGSDSGGAGSAPVAPVPEPTPVPPSVPVPPAVPVVLNQRVVDWSRDAAETVAGWDDCQRIGLVYDAMADHLRRGNLTRSNVWSAVVKGTEIVTEASGTQSAWKPWRQEMGRLTTELSQAGKLDDEDEIFVYLKSVTAGLQQAVPPEAPKLGLGEGVKVVEFSGRIVEALVTGSNGGAN